MEIYLDMNVFIAYIKQENQELIKSINYGLNNTNIKFPFSPAHIEEIAVINRKSSNARKYINQNLIIIKKISKNYEYFPNFHEIVKIYESPIDCYNRVINDYEKTTLYAENLEKNKVTFWGTLDTTFKNDIDKIISEELFEHEEILNELKIFLTDEINKKLLSTQKYIYEQTGIFPEFFSIKSFLETNKIPTYEVLQYDHMSLEFFIELIFDFLDKIGFKNDKKAIKNEKYRSRMHDISHAIYASKANYFVTNDKKFTYKTIAVYQLLKIKTNIISINKFIEFMNKY